MKRLLLLGFIYTISMSVQSAVINGDFSGASGWVDASLQNSSGSKGNAEIDNGIAVLKTPGNGNTGTYISSWAQGTDSSFFNFTSTTVVDGNWLNFDFLFDNTIVDSTETGPSAQNYFTATLLTESDFNSFATGLVFTGGVDFLLTANHVGLDVSSYLNKTVILSFDIHDGADQRDSILKLDNVEFSDTKRIEAINNFAPQTGSGTVPEPSTLFILMVSTLVGRKFLKD